MIDLTDLEDLIRAAQHRRAEQAADPVRMHHALPALRARRRRRVRLASTCASVAVTLAVAVAVSVVVHGGPPVQGNSAPTVTASPAPSWPLRYKPTWLPPGLVARARSVDWHDIAAVHVAEDWSYAAPNAQDNGSPPPDLSLSVTRYGSSAPPTPTGGPGAVQINGITGQLTRRDDTFSLVWRPDPQTELWLTTQNSALSEVDLIHVATSVRPDPAAVTPALRLSWLPAGATASGVIVESNASTSWREVTIAAIGTSWTLNAMLFPGSAVWHPPAGAQYMTIAGHRAYLEPIVHSWDSKTLTVDFGAYTLDVIGNTGNNFPENVSTDDLVRIAAGASTGPRPDVAWLGKP